jgi:chromosome segregation ATPase
LDTQRVLGQLLEAHRAANEERQGAKEERAGMKLSVDKLSEIVNNLQRSFDNLDNTMQQTTKELVAINAARLGERVDKIEEITKNFAAVESDVMFWKRVVGGGWGIVWRVGGMLGASGGLSAIVAHFVR